MGLATWEVPTFYGSISVPNPKPIQYKPGIQSHLNRVRVLSQEKHPFFFLSYVSKHPILSSSFPAATQICQLFTLYTYLTYPDGPPIYFAFAWDRTRATRYLDVGFFLVFTATATNSTNQP